MPSFVVVDIGFGAPIDQSFVGGVVVVAVVELVLTVAFDQSLAALARSFVGARWQALWSPNFHLVSPAELVFSRNPTVDYLGNSVLPLFHPRNLLLVLLPLLFHMLHKGIDTMHRTVVFSVSSM